ncbi:MAG: hypothetical protein MUF83_22890 [Acidimicrobiales bacterium]|nr:hypothetical protein [Acidimicrobiales bacterium]
MASFRAYFTPSPSTIPTLVARILFAASDDRPRVEFLLETTPGSFLDLVEEALFPVTELRVCEHGFVITGASSRFPGRVGRLEVDTGPEPPIARYAVPDEPHGDTST